MSILQAPAFVATVPYHVLIMLLIWPPFAWLYFRKRRPATSQEESQQTLHLAMLWLISAMVVDFVGFVLLKNASVHDSTRTLCRLPALDHFDFTSRSFSQPLDSRVDFARS